MRGLLVLGVCALLSACSTYGESFDCALNEGERCTSHSTIHQKMNQGELPPVENAEESASVYVGTEFLLEEGGYYAR